jgi:glycosyltransferase involved in cell wall biosynthesis
VSNQENGDLEVSVVMAVFNGERTLEATLASVLEQSGCAFEFIVIDDGSTDATPRILERMAGADARLRVIRQSNTGLTRALIAGCAQARAPYITRQDCGDLSLPGRLKHQLDFLESNADFVAVACNVTFLAPRGETMFSTSMFESDLKLSADDLVRSDPHGPPHHGSVMMRSSAYQTCGGYRREFYYAQDLDLWTRLVDHGRFGVLSATLYVATYALGSISASRRTEQLVLTSLIVRATLARAARTDETRFLERAAEVRPATRAFAKATNAAGNYFVGSTLLRRNPRAARSYLLDSMKESPNLRCFLKVILSLALPSKEAKC